MDKKEHFIATLQACYFGDRNAFNEIVRIYDDMEQRIDKAVEYINNFSVDKNFSFPLMKRWEENQVKSCIDYEFNDTLKRNLLNILKGDDINDR